MLNFLLKSVLVMSAAGTVALLAYWLLRPMVRRFGSAIWAGRCLLVVLAVLLVPFWLPGNIRVVERPQSVQSTASMDEPHTAANPQPTPAAQAEDPPPALAHVDLSVLCAAVWLAGTAGFLLADASRRRRFYRQLFRASRQITDRSVLQGAQQACCALGLRKPPPLYENPYISSPLLVGIFRPRIVLPCAPEAPIDLDMAIRHELLHYRRRDLWWKLCFQMARAVHWFNPLVHRLAKEYGTLCELACDEALVRGLSAKERKAYGLLLLDTLEHTARQQEIYCASLRGNGNLERRLTLIMKPHPISKKALAIGMAVLVLVVSSSVGVAYALSPSAGEITIETTPQPTAEETLPAAEPETTPPTTEPATQAPSTQPETTTEATTQAAKTPTQTQSNQSAAGKTDAPDNSKLQPATQNKLAWPVPGLTEVNASFGNKWNKTHTGIDITGSNAWGKPIVAAERGKVTFAGYREGGSGYCVQIDHGNGMETFYSHCESVSVAVGATVARGQTIAKVGSTGFSTGPHLHFEVRVNGTPVDPMPYLGR